ncbi:MAG: hypothetical protein WAT65_06465 [Candidatus Nanopelagicales bacterium]
MPFTRESTSAGIAVLAPEIDLLDEPGGYTAGQRIAPALVSGG